MIKWLIMLIIFFVCVLRKLHILGCSEFGLNNDHLCQMYRHQHNNKSTITCVTIKKLQAHLLKGHVTAYRYCKLAKVDSSFIWWNSHFLGVRKFWQSVELKFVILIHLCLLWFKYIWLHSIGIRSWSGTVPKLFAPKIFTFTVLTEVYLALTNYMHYIPSM